MGKKRQRVRWSTVDGLKWGDDDSGSDGSSSKSHGSSTASKKSADNHQQKTADQNLCEQKSGEATTVQPLQQSVTSHIPQLLATGGGDYVQSGYNGGGYPGGGQQWGHQYHTAPPNWQPPPEYIPPRFEKRTQVKPRYRGGHEDSDVISDHEDMPNGFTKIRSKNLDILFKKEYYQQKLRPKDKGENGSAPIILPVTTTEQQQQQPDTQTVVEDPQQESQQPPVVKRVISGGSFDNIDVNEIPEFKPSQNAATSDTPPEYVDPAIYHQPPGYYPVTSSCGPLPPPTDPGVAPTDYPPPPPPDQCRPNVYLYSPADNTLIQCKGVVLANPQGQYYYLAYPVSPGGETTPPMAGYVAQFPGGAPPNTPPIMNGMPPTVDNSSCGNNSSGEAYSESATYYSSPPSCMSSQCQSSNPQTPNSSGTSTQPASPPLLQSYHPTNWFSRETKEEIEEEDSPQPNTIQHQDESPTVTYIPGLPNLTSTQPPAKKKKKKKKKVGGGGAVASASNTQITEHRDSLSSSDHDHMLSSLPSQGEVDGSEECSRVSAEDPSITGTPTSSLAEPVVEVFLTDDLADSMLNPPTDPECSDEETLKLNNNNKNISTTTVTIEGCNNEDEVLEANNENETSSNLVRDDTYTNLEEIQDYVKEEGEAEGSSEVTEHLTDSGIEDNAFNISSEHIHQDVSNNTEQHHISNIAKEAENETIITEECETIEVNDNIDIGVTAVEEAGEENTEASNNLTAVQFESQNNDTPLTEVTNNEKENHASIETNSQVTAQVNEEVKEEKVATEAEIVETTVSTKPNTKKRNKRSSNNQRDNKSGSTITGKNNEQKTEAHKSEEESVRVEFTESGESNNCEAADRMSYSAACRISSSKSEQASMPAKAPTPPAKNVKESSTGKSSSSSKAANNKKGSNSSVLKKSSLRRSREKSCSEVNSEEWEVVPLSVTNQPEQWEKKEKKGKKKKNKKIVFADSQNEGVEELEDSEVPCLETVPIPSKPETEAPIPEQPEQQQSRETSETPKEAEVEEKENTEDIENTTEEKKKAKKKKKKTNSNNENEENAKKIMICDNQIEVRYSRLVRRASEVLDTERLEVVKNSGYCDLLLVEKLGSGIFRGSMHFGRLHQGKYVPPDRSDAIMPQSTDDDHDQDDQIEEEAEAEIEEVTTRMPAVAEEIDLD